MKFHPYARLWAPIGEQAQVPIIAAHDIRVLTGVLNIQSGDCLLQMSARYRQADAQMVLRELRAHWRGWQTHLVSGSPSGPTRASHSPLGSPIAHPIALVADGVPGTQRHGSFVATCDRRCARERTDARPGYDCETRGATYHGHAASRSPSSSRHFVGYFLARGRAQINHV